MTTLIRPEQANLTKYWDFGSGTMRVPCGGAFPGGPADGDIFYRTDEDKLYIYDGAAWEEMPAHNVLSTIHTDTLADNVVDGDVIIGNATPKWSRLAIAVPAVNVRNVLGIDNAELRPSWKTALDATDPANIAAAAAPGVSLIFSHRDHVHAHPAGLGANLHHTQIHDVIGADHTLTGAQWSLVGATALNTIGLLTPSADVSAGAEAILKSTAAGDLALHDLTATGQLSAGAGIDEGIILGADAQWYRSAANMMRTPDSVTIDVGLNVGTPTGAAIAGQIEALNAAVNTTASFTGIKGSWTKTAGDTDASDHFIGADIFMEVNHADTVGNFLAGTIKGKLTAGTVAGWLIGLEAIVDGDGGTVSQSVAGLNVNVDLEAAMTSIVGDVYGVRILVDADEDPTGSVYMLWLGEATGIDYGIYQDGTAKNYLGGSVGIGAVPAVEKLDVIGHVFVKGTDGWDGVGDLAILRLGGPTDEAIYAKFGGPGLNFAVYKDGAGGDAGAHSYTAMSIAETTGNVFPGANKTQDLGLSGTAWDDCWADDFQNEPDYYYMDSRKDRNGCLVPVNDLAVICGIRPSGAWGARTGLPVINDASLPSWIFTRDKETGETLYGPDGKPWLSLKMTTSLSWGAIRQLDGYRLVADAERKAIREQIGILQNQLALLEQAAQRGT